MRRSCLAFTVAALACLGVPASAAAEHPDAAAVDGHVPEAVQEALGGEVTELPSGLYEVDPARGPDFVTHGPDTESDVADHGQTLGPGDPERAPVCASDQYYQQVLYAHHVGQPNRLVTDTTVLPQIRSSIKRSNAVLNEESLASGGVTADYEVLCDSAGEIRVDSFDVPAGQTSFSQVRAAARADGFDDPEVDYTIFFDYDHPDYCGVGTFRVDDSLSVNNSNNTGNAYGITQVDCWNGITPMHENAHNQGAVQSGAPYASGSAHCYDENDVMCYADGGSLIPPSGLEDRCTDRLYFDCGFDTYFDSAPEDCEYLASSWNMGSRLNRFIVFGGPEPASNPCPSPPANPDPSPPPATGAGAGSGSPPESASPSGIGAPAAAERLSNREPVRGTAAAPGSWRLYELRVPGRQSRLKVTLECGSDCADQLDLYVRKGSDATLSVYDCRSAGPRSDERCKVRLPDRGTWHIGVYTAAGPGGAPFEITAAYKR